MYARKSSWYSFCRSVFWPSDLKCPHHVWFYCRMLQSLVSYLHYLQRWRLNEVWSVQWFSPAFSLIYSKYSTKFFVFLYIRKVKSFVILQTIWNFSFFNSSQNCLTLDLLLIPVKKKLSIVTLLLLFLFILRTSNSVIIHRQLEIHFYTKKNRELQSWFQLLDIYWKIMSLLKRNS